MNNNLKNISEKLSSINKKVYIIWWFCREMIIWNKDYNWDIDLVTDALPEEIKNVLNVVWEVGKKYWTCIIVEWKQSFEITTMREDIWSINNRKPANVIFTDSVEIDALRRDFTCNSIYYDFTKDIIIDPLDWKSDIKNNIIRFVWNKEERLNEDVLRIMRFIRFKNKYWFIDQDNKIINEVKNYVSLLENISIERIKEELDKILLLENNVQALEDLKYIWFFKYFIPEIDELDKCVWNKWHLEWDVWIHTKMCVEEMNKIIIRDSIIDEKEKLILLWSIFLHDIWKLPTYTVDEKWEWHYYNHENIWSKIFKEVTSKKLNFSKKETEEITFIIKEHIRLFMIPDMKTLKSRKLMMNKYFKKLLLVWEADNKWRIPMKLDRFNEILEIYNSFKDILKTKVFLTGKDILEKHPELTWKDIWERLENLNNQILIKD